jgi:hypothetical protein
MAARISLSIEAILIAAGNNELRERRQRAAAVFHHDIFRLEDTVGALLAIDGQSGESWFLPSALSPFSRRLQAEGLPDSDAAGRGLNC